MQEPWEIYRTIIFLIKYSVRRLNEPYFKTLYFIIQFEQFSFKFHLWEDQISHISIK